MVAVFFFQAEDGIRDVAVTGVQTCALPICYEKIAVELRNIIGIGFDCRSKWKIISPISLEDAKKITDFSEGGFVDRKSVV